MPTVNANALKEGGTRKPIAILMIKELGGA